jgi:hypothetical protein
MRLLAAAALALLGACAPAQAAVPAGLGALDSLPVLDATSHPASASSHAPVGDNFDFGPFLYTDDRGGKVLMEAQGPGVIDRFWMTGNSIDDFGNIRIYFDGEEQPRVDLPASTFFSGKQKAFPAPLCGGRDVSSGGSYCNVRMPFRKSVRVVASANVDYYNIGYTTYPVGTRVRTFDPRDVSAVATEAALAATAGRDPQILPAGPSHAGSATLAAGSARTIARIDHAGTLRAIRVAIDPHDDAALQNVWLQARWDGAKTPAVSAPLADLFLTGAGERGPARGLLAGYDRHAGYLYFPMPFARSAQVTLVNHDTRPIAAKWNVQESSAAYADFAHLHATFAQDPETDNGSDYVMLDAPGQGKVVGVSFTEQGPWSVDDAFFMEGDERVYVDGSRSPAIYGTGTEDFFSGGYYYDQGAFTLPDHGLTVEEPGSAPATARTSQYRLMLQDPWSFRDGLRLGIEHGAGDGLATAARSVVFWYGDGDRALRKTDAIAVGGPAYHDTQGSPVSLKAFFEGDHDGNVSNPAFDQIFPGAQRPPPGTESFVDPLGESVTSEGRFHPPGSVIRFGATTTPDNHGMILRRQLDHGTYGERAEVLVNDSPAGVWLTPGLNDSKRWTDSDFAVPASLTAGRSRQAVELHVLPSDGAPRGEGWTDFDYRVYSLTRG